MLRETFEASEISTEVQRAFRRAVHKYAHRRNVTGVDIGWKVKGGELREGDICIRIHVREKHESNLLAEREIISTEIDEVATDVIQAVWVPNQGGNYLPNPRRMQRQMPVQPGLSVGVRNGESGTLGMVATETIENKPCWVLSDHVLCPPDGDGVLLQPGPSDAFPDPKLAIGRFMRRHRRIGVALAAIESALYYDECLFETEYPISGIRPPAVGDILTKGGRTTDVTSARVHGAGWYEQCDAGFTLVTLDGGSETEVSMGGDSGAIWYDSEMNGVGMQNWGERDGVPDSEWALASDLPAAAALLGFIV